jgi:hypothetical protein
MYQNIYILRIRLCLRFLVSDGFHSFKKMFFIREWTNLSFLRIMFDTLRRQSFFEKKNSRK